MAGGRNDFDAFDQRRLLAIEFGRVNGVKSLVCGNGDHREESVGVTEASIER